MRSRTRRRCPGHSRVLPCVACQIVAARSSETILSPAMVRARGPVCLPRPELAGGVQPADRRTVSGTPERFQLEIPWFAEQPGKLLLQRTWLLPALGTTMTQPRDAGRSGRERHRGPEPVLGHEDVA